MIKVDDKGEGLLVRCGVRIIVIASDKLTLDVSMTSSPSMIDFHQFCLSAFCSVISSTELSTLHRVSSAFAALLRLPLIMGSCPLTPTYNRSTYINITDRKGCLALASTIDLQIVVEPLLSWKGLWDSSRQSTQMFLGRCNVVRCVEAKYKGAL